MVRKRMMPRQRRRNCFLWLVVALIFYSSVFLLAMSLQREANAKAQRKGQKSPEIFLNGGNARPTMKQILHPKPKSFFPSNRRNWLGSALSQTYENSTWELLPVVSVFLTRLYNPELVHKGAGRMAPPQLLVYHNQTGTRSEAEVRYFNRIVSLDKVALRRATVESPVDEILLLVFNDWDHNVDKFISELHRLSTFLNPLQESVEGDIPNGLIESLKDEPVDPTKLVSPRLDAFGNALYLNEKKEMKRDEELAAEWSRSLLFLWPNPTSSSELSQVVAAIRRADFEGTDFLGDKTFGLVLRSPGLFFCSKGMSHVVRYNGPASLHEMSNFITINTLSHLQLKSADELRSVLWRFDALTLIVCKGEGNKEKVSTSPLRDILFNNELTIRFGLRAVLPTFFLQVEEFEGFDELDWDKLNIVSFQRMEPKNLRFMKSLYVNEFSGDFIEKLELLPTSNNTRLIVLKRDELTSEGTRGANFSDFSAHILSFPGPSKKTDHVMWAKTVGARLIDFVENNAMKRFVPARVNGKNLQELYEQHFHVSLMERAARTRTQPLSKEGDFKTTAPSNSNSKEYKPRLLVLVVLSSTKMNVDMMCERAIFHAAHLSSQQDGIQFATVNVEDSPDLVEELRFSIWRYSNKTRAAFCEVYVFHPDSKVVAMDLNPNETYSPQEGWLNLFLHDKQEKTMMHDAMTTVSHPSPDEFLTALMEMRTHLQKVTDPSTYSEFRTSLYGMKGGFAPWFLWLPPFETVPLLVHVQKQNPMEEMQQKTTTTTTTMKKSDAMTGKSGVTLLLVHDTSCGMTVNHLKAFRLLAKCLESQSESIALDLVEYDLSEGFLKPDRDGQQLRSSITKQYHPHYSRIYLQLKPFMEDFKRLQPPQLIALNKTSVLTTFGSSFYHNSTSTMMMMMQKNSHKSYMQTLVRLAGYADPQLKSKSLLKCMQQTILLESRRRSRYRVK
ncbi:hypothetical protein MOQ_005559 [Trypanosoma cruzi marinkellei]|uniref:Uncharacterized protein n=1 Tax=Trypanosoma cruzi marinkellei TaxID=85056 RepID=K2NP59_TRYCR|nr:hypothetical protein MOQ_005559 [Trypanosoma cruzi marinkellei]